MFKFLSPNFELKLPLKGFRKMRCQAFVIVGFIGLVRLDGMGVMSVSPPAKQTTDAILDARTSSEQIPDRYAGVFRRKQQNATFSGIQPVKIPSSATPPMDVIKEYTPAELAEKRKFVRQYAWGYSRVSPHSKQPSSTGPFGGTKLGVTTVDALDSLWIMGLRDEFRRGRHWVVENLNFAEVNADISLFECNMRIMGGLLSAFALSNDTTLAQKAFELGRLLLPAFDVTSTGIPPALYNFKTKAGKFYPWIPGGGAILSEIGSFHLEFAFLSNMTNDTTFVNKALRIREVLDKAQKRNGLYSNYVNPQSGQFETQWYTSVGAMGDSFYEYLLKSWLLSNRTDATAKRMYDEAISAIDNRLVRTSIDGNVYFIKLDQDTEENEMEHLACFMGGLYGLGAPYATNTSDNFTLRGDQITSTCRATYAMTQTQLGPDTFDFTPGQRGIRIGTGAYYLRPETVESYFVMWRRTRDPKYRQWGWEVVQAIEKYCRAEAGYAGLLDVNRIANPVTDNQDDVQYTYFLAEVLKYLYLLFVDEKSDGTSTAADDGGVDISLEEFVFNTEAHPLPIYGTRILPFVNITTNAADGRFPFARQTMWCSSLMLLAKLLTPTQF